MLSAFTNSFKIPELRNKIFFTLSMLFVARIGANIPLPGVDPTPLQNFFEDQTASGSGGVLSLYNMFTGGALLKGAVMALGIMPYISASIIFQLMTAVVPSLARLAREGDVGRQKITQYTRLATLVICLIQGVLLVIGLKNPAGLFSGFDTATYGSIILNGSAIFVFNSVIILTTGTIILMWLGEQITEKGIGQGVSLLITVGILADLPGAMMTLYRLVFAPIGTNRIEVPQLAVMFVLLLVVTAGLVAVIQAMRKIPVQYAKRVVGRKVYGGQSSFLPLKVNYSGVMPVIFASAILMFPQQIFSWMAAGFGSLSFLTTISNWFLRGTVSYYFIFGSLILLFSYFWVSVMFKPIQIAEDLKKYGGYIPGVRPGEPTAKFLDFVMTRLTFAGAAFLTIIAVFPDVLLFSFNVPFQISNFFGGTGMLITVGVILQTLQQVETYLLQRHYDGFLKKGRIRGRNPAKKSRAQLTDTVEMGNLRPLMIVLGLIFVIGIASWIIRTWAL
ncbi:MAG: preprotein translocase subunit SecY [Opitutaceae bacterium]|nr:preprotein translocase subunit SecY [Opitutaceae bacterium]|tara:strand:- start:1379 stop:2887 length:1509 start_codon:yes stop_codon:yes gene_type:complete